MLNEIDFFSFVFGCTTNWGYSVGLIHPRALLFHSQNFYTKLVSSFFLSSIIAQCRKCIFHGYLLANLPLIVFIISINELKQLLFAHGYFTFPHSIFLFTLTNSCLNFPSCELQEQLFINNFWINFDWKLNSRLNVIIYFATTWSKSSRSTERWEIGKLLKMKLFPAIR